MGRKWTKEEIDFIRKNKAEMTNKEIAEKLNRTEPQLAYAIRKYHVQRTKEEYNALMEKLYIENRIPNTLFFNKVLK